MNTACGTVLSHTVHHDAPAAYDWASLDIMGSRKPPPASQPAASYIAANADKPSAIRKNRNQANHVRHAECWHLSIHVRIARQHRTPSPHATAMTPTPRRNPSCKTNTEGGSIQAIPAKTARPILPGSEPSRTARNGCNADRLNGLFMHDGFTHHYSRTARNHRAVSPARETAYGGTPPAMPPTRSSRASYHPHRKCRPHRRRHVSTMPSIRGETAWCAAKPHADMGRYAGDA